MAETPIKLDEALAVLRAIFGKPATPKKIDLSWMGDLSQIEANAADPEEDVKESRVVSRVLELFDGGGMGAGLKSAQGTRWGLFNAITEHVDHEMGRSQDTRLDSAWFGRGSAFKKDAFKELTSA